MAKEPIPTSEFRISLLNYFLSIGGTQLYQVVSGMCCRVYEDNGKLTPNLNESAWYDTGTDKGWKRDGANFPSYLVRQVNVDAFLDTGVISYYTDIQGAVKEFYVTVRSVPKHSDNPYQLIGLTIKQRYQYINSPVRPTIKLIPETIAERMLKV